MRRRFILGAIMALSLTLSACALFGGRADDAGTQASVATPAAWTSTDPSIKTAATSPESLAGWWRQFGDAQLDQLIAEAAQQLLRPALVPGPYEFYHLALAHAAPPLTL